MRAFDAGEAPKYLYARFSELIKCPDIPPRFYKIPPNDRVFKLTQSDINPCLWRYEDDTWITYVIVLPPPGKAEFHLIDKPLNYAYFIKTIEIPLEEGEVHHNEARACIWNAAHLGTGVVTWRLESIKILADLNIETANDLFMEMRPLVDGNKVYKYCRLQDATNIAIEYESD